MFFCPDCNNSFNITKNIKTSAQIGGKNGGPVEQLYKEFIEKVLSEEETQNINVDNMTIDDLAKDTNYKKLKQKQKDKVLNRLIELLPIEKKNLPKADKLKKHLEHFICKNCGYYEPIKDGTIIFSRTSGDVSQTYVSPDILQLKHSDIIRITSRYECSNPKCQSHKDFEKREAKITRWNNSYGYVMICMACDTIVS